jgi:serine/threonine-protein kinase
VPAGFDAAVARCLAKSPDRRYPSVAALLADLRASLAEARDQADLRPAVALHVGIGLDDGGDAALTDAEAILALSRRAAEDAGLAVIVDAGGVLLAAGALPGDPDAARAARARLLEAARRLESVIATRPEARAAATLTVHAAEAHVRAGRVEGGDLLRLTEWAAPAGRGLVITEAARAGLGEGY